MRRRLLIVEHGNEPSDLAVNMKALGYEVDVFGAALTPNQTAIEQADLVLLQVPESISPILPVLSELRSLPYYPPLMAILDCDEASRSALLLECGCDCVVRRNQDVLQVKAWIEALLRRRDMYRIVLEKSEPMIRVG